jgi:hypothetical protein
MKPPWICDAAAQMLAKLAFKYCTQCFVGSGKSLRSKERRGLVVHYLDGVCSAWTLARLAIAMRIQSLAEEKACSWLHFQPYGWAYTCSQTR